MANKNYKNFSLEDINNDPCMIDFIESRPIREGTVRTYIHRIKRYSNLIGKSPNMLVEEAEKEQDQAIKPRNRKIKRYLINYRKHLEESGVNPTAIRRYITSIKSFYSSFDIEVPRMRFATRETEKPMLESTITFDDIRKIVKIANLRDKAIILLMVSSGMGAAEIKSLNYGDFLNSISEYVDLIKKEQFNLERIVRELKKSSDLIGTWKIRRIKTGMPHITFNTPESTQAILDYLIERERERRYPHNLEDPLFISRQERRISNMGFIHIFQRLNDKIGLGLKANGRHLFTSHQLRKLFTSTLYSKGTDKLTIDWLLGHRVNPITEAYFKTNEKDLKTKYMQVVKYLTLEKVKTKIVTTKEYDALLKDSRAKDEKISILEKRMELMEQLLSDEKVLEELQKR